MSLMHQGAHLVRHLHLLLLHLRLDVLLLGGGQELLGVNLRAAEDELEDVGEVALTLLEADHALRQRGDRVLLVVEVVTRLSYSLCKKLADRFLGMLTRAD